MLSSFCVAARNDTLRNRGINLVSIERVLIVHGYYNLLVRDDAKNLFRLQIFLDHWKYQNRLNLILISLKRNLERPGASSHLIYNNELTFVSGTHIEHVILENDLKIAFILIHEPNYYLYEQEVHNLFPTSDNPVTREANFIRQPVRFTLQDIKFLQSQNICFLSPPSLREIYHGNRNVTISLDSAILLPENMNSFELTKWKRFNVENLGLSVVEILGNNPGFLEYFLPVHQKENNVFIGPLKPPSLTDVYTFLDNAEITGHVTAEAENLAQILLPIQPDPITVDIPNFEADPKLDEALNSAFFQNQHL